jgi:hypothetical protein
MIAWNENQPRALADLAQQLLQHVIMRLRPDRASFDAPEIDDIADQIDRLGVVMLQKFEKGIRLTGSGAEVNIGYEQGPEVRTAPMAALPSAVSVLHAQRRLFPLPLDRESLIFVSAM